SQAVRRGVSELHRRGWRAEGHRGKYRPEDLLLRHNRCGMNIAEQRGREVESPRRHLNLRLPAGGALSHSLIHHAAYTLELDGSDDGADVDGLVQRRPDTQGTHAILNFFDQRLRDAFLHQQPRTGAAYLSLVEPDAVHQAFYCAVEI